MARLMSFMYIRKCNGPITDTWGTPQVMVDIFALKLLMKKDCFQSVKYESNHLLDIPLTP